MIIRKGFHIELMNRSNNRVIFSAATDELEKATFDRLWQSIGDNLYNADPGAQVGYYEIRVTPLQ